MSHIELRKQPLLADLSLQKATRICGRYRLSELVAGIDQNGRPEWKIGITDGSATVMASWEKMDVSMPPDEDSLFLLSGYLPANIQVGGMLNLEAKISYIENQPIASIVRIEPVGLRCFNYKLEGTLY